MYGLSNPASSAGSFFDELYCSGCAVELHRERLFALGRKVDDGGQQRAKQNPGNLVPVKEREAKELGRGPRVDAGERERNRGQDQQPVPGGSFALGIPHD